MPNYTTLRFDPSGSTGLRFAVRTESGFESVLDSGEGRVSASPVETLCTALGGCLSMDVISILRKKRQEVTSYEVVVGGERRTEHPKSFASMEVLHRVTGRNLSRVAVEDAVRLSVERYCTVYHSLHPAISIVQEIEVLEG